MNVNSASISDPLFRDAVAAIDAGDLSTLEALLTAHPRLLGERLDYGEGYFRRPYLLWFVAENPIRNGTLPANIALVARLLLRTARRERIDTLQQQVQYALGLVCSGRIVRECGVQDALIDVLVDAGADPGGALLPALAHRELAAVEHLLRRGAALTLPAAACLGRLEDTARLLQVATHVERQCALAGAALNGQALTLALLLDFGVDLDAYSPPEFHPHATALHHAVDSGSLETVKTLVGAGAALDRKDRNHQGTPLDWADYLHRTEIAAFLRQQEAVR